MLDKISNIKYYLYYKGVDMKNDNSKQLYVAFSVYYDIMYSYGQYDSLPKKMCKNMAGQECLLSPRMRRRGGICTNVDCSVYRGYVELYGDNLPKKMQYQAEEEEDVIGDTELINEVIVHKEDII